MYSSYRICSGKASLRRLLLRFFAARSRYTLFIKGIRGRFRDEKSVFAALHPAVGAGQSSAAGRLPAGKGGIGRGCCLIESPGLLCTARTGREPARHGHRLSRDRRVHRRRRNLSHRGPEHRGGPAGAAAGLSHRRGGSGNASQLAGRGP